MVVDRLDTRAALLPKVNQTPLPISADGYESDVAETSTVMRLIVLRCGSKSLKLSSVVTYLLPWVPAS